MAKTFGFDPAKGIAAMLSGIPTPTTTGPVQRRGKKTRGLGLPPTVRGLPWSKMLRSFREKSS
ncbi:MAG: hypothetical protein NT013_03490 [Planctomycetia bacterium]|nr:hypothetical protein [Planctomycetia bacterium]